jgi:hypothetical protein
MFYRKEVIVPTAYNPYIQAANENELTDALRKSTKQFRKLLKNIPPKKINYAYAEGKWTIKELFQHVMDAERVFVVRALWFSRKDPTALPGFDENTWADTANAASRKWKDMIDEFKSLRSSTEAFFGSLDPEQLQLSGTANNNVMNVGGLGFVCAGHVNHHIRIIKERYLANAVPEKGKKKNKNR